MKTARTGAYQVDLRAGQPMVTVGWFNSHAHAEPNRTSKDPALLRADALVNGQVVVPAGGQLKVPAPRVVSAGFDACTSPGSGLFHSVGVAVGDDDVAVVQEPVEHADGGGVLGQEPAPGLERPVGSDAE